MSNEIEEPIKTIFDAPADDEQTPDDTYMGSKYKDEDGDVSHDKDTICVVNGWHPPDYRRCLLLAG